MEERLYESARRPVERFFALLLCQILDAVGCVVSIDDVNPAIVIVPQHVELAVVQADFPAELQDLGLLVLLSTSSVSRSFAEWNFRNRASRDRVLWYTNGRIDLKIGTRMSSAPAGVMLSMSLS